MRKTKGKLFIKPARKNVAAMMRKVRAIIKSTASMTQEYLIGQLNPVIRGWANYHCNQVAKDTFTEVDHYIWWLLWQWARRRHPTKPRQWVKNKYFPPEGSRNWVFRAATTDDAGESTFVRLFNAADVPIRRHAKIRAAANPFDPRWDSYLATRRRLPSGRTVRSPRPIDLSLNSGTDGSGHTGL